MAECQDLLLSTGSEQKENETKEERTEKLCEPCKEEGKSFKAKGYCLDCREYLCETCFDSHCRPRPMRKHQLCSTDEVPDSVKENISEKKDDISPLVCQIHDRNVIVSYCETHRQFCCEKCLSIGHVACKDLKNITRFNKEEFKSFCKSMKCFKEKWECEKQRALSNLSDVNCCYENTIRFVTNKLGEIKAADSAYLASVISACESTITQLDEWLSDVEDFKETGFKAVDQNMNWLLYMQSTKYHSTVELFAQSELLKDPQNIRVLEDSLLVACSTNKNVYRVYRSGPVSSVLPEPLDFPVVSIDYNAVDRLLYVGGENDCVYVYQF